MSCEECDRRAELARQEEKAGFVVCDNCKPVIALAPLTQQDMLSAMLLVEEHLDLTTRRGRAVLIVMEPDGETGSHSCLMTSGLVPEDLVRVLESELNETKRRLESPTPITPDARLS